MTRNPPAVLVALVIGALLGGPGATKAADPDVTEAVKTIDALATEILQARKKGETGGVLAAAKKRVELAEKVRTRLPDARRTLLTTLSHFNRSISILPGI